MERNAGARPDRLADRDVDRATHRVLAPEVRRGKAGQHGEPARDGIAQQESRPDLGAELARQHEDGRADDVADQREDGAAQADMALQGISHLHPRMDTG